MWTDSTWMHLCLLVLVGLPAAWSIRTFEEIQDATTAIATCLHETHQVMRNNEVPTAMIALTKDVLDLDLTTVCHLKSEDETTERTEEKQPYVCSIDLASLADDQMQDSCQSNGGIFQETSHEMTCVQGIPYSELPASRDPRESVAAIASLKTNPIIVTLLNIPDCFGRSCQDLEAPTLFGKNLQEYKRALEHRLMDRGGIGGTQSKGQPADHRPWKCRIRDSRSKPHSTSNIAKTSQSDWAHARGSSRVYSAHTKAQNEALGEHIHDELGSEQSSAESTWTSRWLGLFCGIPLILVLLS